MKIFLSILGVLSMWGFFDNDPKEILLSYIVLDSGDTINRLYMDSVKSGKWFEDYVIDRSYYYQVGNYLMGLKEGEWRIYNALDENIEIVNYHRGAKNGKNIIFKEGKIIAIGDQIGMFFTQEKDTILVTDPIDLEDYATEIENSVYNLRHGIWYFMDPFTRDTTEIIEYNFGHIIDDINYARVKNAYRDSVIESNMPHRRKNYKPIKKKPRKYYFPQ